MQVLKRLNKLTFEKSASMFYLQSVKINPSILVVIVSECVP